MIYNDFVQINIILAILNATYIHYNSEGCIIIISPLIVEDTQN